jgi:TsgA-like MFS transporter
LAACSDYPETQDTALADPSPRTWPASAWLCIAALCTYTLAQNSILWWLPQYAQNVMGASASESGALVGQFWSGMFAAQLFVAWWVLRVGVRRLLWLCAGCTLIFSLPLWLVENVSLLWWLAALWGFANLGLLKVVLSYGSTFTAVASPRLVSSLLLGATTGTALSPWVSSQIVAVGDAVTALKFGSSVYLLMFALLALAVVLAPGKGVSAQAAVSKSIS